MFKIITPQEHKDHEDLINEFDEHVYQTYMISGSNNDKEKATYFIACDEEGKYLGGAFVTTRDAADILQSLFHGRDILGIGRGIEIVVCGGIQTRLKRTPFHPSNAFFYNELYLHLARFAQSHRIKSILLHTSYREKGLIESCGKWPMDGEMKDHHHREMIYSLLNIKTILKNG